MPDFLIDAQLPLKLKALFQQLNCGCTHTLDLPLKNKTPDSELLRLSAEKKLIVITKDSDFVESYLLKKTPKKLLLISCGNIGNNDLEKLLRTNLRKILSEFEDNNFIELNRKDIIIHS